MISINTIKVGPPTGYRYTKGPHNKTPYFARIVFYRMRKLHMTVEDVSRISGCSLNVLYNLRNGRMPSGNSLAAIGGAVGLELFWREKPIQFVRTKNRLDHKASGL